MADTLVQTLQNKEYSELKDKIERVVAKKVVDRIEAKKADVLNKLNGTEVPVMEQ